MTIKLSGIRLKVKVKVTQSCQTLCDPMNCTIQEFSRPEYWSGQPFPSSGDPPNPGIEPRSPTLQADCLQSEPPGKPKWWASIIKLNVGKKSRAEGTQEDRITWIQKRERKNGYLRKRPRNFICWYIKGKAERRQDWVRWGDTEDLNASIKGLNFSRRLLKRFQL